jgi:hypothetical protein
MAETTLLSVISYFDDSRFMSEDERSSLMKAGVRISLRQCPSCAAQGQDKEGRNLAISVEDPKRVYCYRGCTEVQIKEACKRRLGGQHWLM